MLFRDRHDAGEKLADALREYADRRDALVLALPRGGAPVGYEIATRLGLPLDVLIVRKLGVPWHPELAMGAIASGGVVVADRALMAELGISAQQFEAVLEQETLELTRREQLFRGDRRPLVVVDKMLIVVDDGLATGTTMRAAVEGLRQCGPAQILVAVPVASADACQALRPLVDTMICLAQPPQFLAVGVWYRDFAQTTDAEVRNLLDAAARAHEARTFARPSERPAASP